MGMGESQLPSHPKSHPKSHHRVEWWYSHSSTATGCRVYWQNVIKLALSLSILRHLTFRRISRHLVVVEEWEYHHSNRLIEASRMVVFPFFYATGRRDI